MRKGVFIFCLVLSMLITGCSKTEDDLSNSKNNEIKDTIDLVLSYEKGYDDTIKKHISEKNFYVCNYVEFYSNYIGEVDLENYESEIISLREDQGRYIVCMKINLKAVSVETHSNDDGDIHEEGKDEALGEDVPVEIILNDKSGELYIESFKEYENLEKARELNDGFK